MKTWKELEKFFDDWAENFFKKFKRSTKEKKRSSNKEKTVDRLKNFLLTFQKMVLSRVKTVKTAYRSYKKDQEALRKYQAKAELLRLQTAKLDKQTKKKNRPFSFRTWLGGVREFKFLTLKENKSKDKILSAEDVDELLGINSSERDKSLSDGGLSAEEVDELLKGGIEDNKLPESKDPLESSKNSSTQKPTEPNDLKKKEAPPVVKTAVFSKPSSKRYDYSGSFMGRAFWCILLLLIFFVVIVILCAVGSFFGVNECEIFLSELGDFITHYVDKLSWWLINYVKYG